MSFQEGRPWQRWYGEIVYKDWKISDFQYFWESHSKNFIKNLKLIKKKKNISVGWVKHCMKQLYFNTVMSVFIEDLTLGRLTSMTSFTKNTTKGVKSATEVRDKNEESFILRCRYHKIILRLLHKTKKNHLFIILITLTK